MPTWGVHVAGSPLALEGAGGGGGVVAVGLVAGEGLLGGALGRRALLSHRRARLEHREETVSMYTHTREGLFWNATGVGCERARDVLGRTRKVPEVVGPLPWSGR